MLDCSETHARTGLSNYFRTSGWMHNPDPAWCSNYIRGHNIVHHALHIRCVVLCLVPPSPFLYYVCVCVYADLLHSNYTLYTRICTQNVMWVTYIVYGFCSVFVWKPQIRDLNRCCIVYGVCEMRVLFYGKIYKFSWIFIVFFFSRYNLLFDVNFSFYFGDFWFIKVSFIVKKTLKKNSQL